MSNRRIIVQSLFTPSAYSNGVQPLRSYSSRTEPEYGYGDGIPFLPDFLDPFAEDKPTPFGAFTSYWWAYLLLVPVVYVGVGMALDASKFGKKA